MAITKTTLPIASDDSGFFSSYDSRSTKAQNVAASASQNFVSPDVIDPASSSSSSFQPQPQNDFLIATAARTPVRPTHPSLPQRNPYHFIRATEWDRPLQSIAAVAAQDKACKDLEDSVRQPQGFPIRLLMSTVERVVREIGEREERMRRGDELLRRKMEEERIMERERVEVKRGETMDKIEVFGDGETKDGMSGGGGVALVENEDIRRLVGAVKVLKERSVNVGGQRGGLRRHKSIAVKKVEDKAVKKEKSGLIKKEDSRVSKNISIKNVAEGRVDKRGRTRGAAKKVAKTD